MAFTADEIIAAFIARTATQANGTRHVTFGTRGRGGSAYVLIWGPSADPNDVKASKVAVQRFNGAVAFRHAGIANVVGAKPRPKTPISKDARGPSFHHSGTFKWALTPQEIQQRYAKADDLVNVIVGAFATGGVPW